MKYIDTSISGRGGHTRGQMVVARNGAYYQGHLGRKTNRNSAAQTTVRQNCAFAARAWLNTLPSTARDNWNNYANSNGYLTGIPPYTSINGYNQFLRVCLYQFDSNQAGDCSFDIGVGTVVLIPTLISAVLHRNPGNPRIYNADIRASVTGTLFGNTTLHAKVAQGSSDPNQVYLSQMRDQFIGGFNGSLPPGTLQATGTILRDNGPEVGTLLDSYMLVQDVPSWGIKVYFQTEVVSP